MDAVDGQYARAKCAPGTRAARDWEDLDEDRRIALRVKLEMVCNVRPGVLLPPSVMEQQGKNAKVYKVKSRSPMLRALVVRVGETWWITRIFDYHPKGKELDTAIDAAEQVRKRLEGQ